MLPYDIDFQEILRYATYAQHAYLDATELGNQYGVSVYSSEFDHSQVQVVIINDGDTGIQWLAIRGTNNIRNVFVDGRIKVIREVRLGVYLHGGFLRTAQEIYQLIKARLDPRREIRITGHSLGGAVAVILAALLTEDSAGFLLGRTVTFGQPMITDSNGVKVLARYPLLRVVNQWDPVVTLPLILSRTHFEFPPTIFYHHLGPQLVLYKDRAPKYSPPAKLIRLVLGFRLLIANHFMDLYVKRIQQQLE